MSSRIHLGFSILSIKEKFLKAKSKAIATWEYLGSIWWFKYSVAVFVLCTFPFWVLLGIAYLGILFLGVLVADITDLLWPAKPPPSKTVEELQRLINSRVQKV